MTRRPITPETIPLELFAETMRHGAVVLGQQALTRYGIVPPDVGEVLGASDRDLRTVQLREALTYVDIDRWIDSRMDELRTQRSVVGQVAPEARSSSA